MQCRTWEKILKSHFDLRSIGLYKCLWSTKNFYIFYFTNLGVEYFKVNMHFPSWSSGFRCELGFNFFFFIYCLLFIDGGQCVLIISIFLDWFCSYVAAGLVYQGIKCSMKSYRLSELSRTEVESLKARPRIDFSSIFSTVGLCLFLKLWIKDLQ